MACFLQGWARSGATEALGQLLALRPRTCHVLPPGQSQAEEMPTQLVELGDTLQVFPGEVDFADGPMASECGYAEFDEPLALRTTLEDEMEKLFEIYRDIERSSWFKAIFLCN